jgi:hypothetical protein
MTRVVDAGPSNVDVVVVALYRLGGAVRRVHTEDVAVEAFRLAPAQFSWRRYSDYPDKDIVRVALTDAAKVEKGRLVKGRAGKPARGKEEDGWQLTPAGARWTAANADRIGGALAGGASNPDRREVDQRCREVRRSPLFNAFNQRGNLDHTSQYEFTDFLGSSPDAPAATIRKRFDRMLTAAEAAEDVDVCRFLEFCRSRFAALFGG